MTTNSPTTINNYNGFLKSLDDKQREKNHVFNGTNTSTNDINSDIEKQMAQLIKNIENAFTYNENQHLLNNNDKKEFDDPNLFYENVDSIQHKKYKKVKKSHKDYKYNITNITNGSCCVNLKPAYSQIKFQENLEIALNIQQEKQETEKKEKTKKEIFAEIYTIDDLLKFIDENKYDSQFEYNIDLESLHNIKEPLTELKNMIGMDKLKDNIVDQILYFSQNLHKITQNGVVSGDFMHTVIYGPPGTGKTEIAKIIGKIYCKMGILKKGTFKKVTRSDLIAGYLGQTALKTRDVINECLEGVLFIDEAYALGNNEKKDSFSKECIDTLCEALSNHKENLMVIIAGYETELKECFFNYNQGLDSRFTWRFKTDEYKGKELYHIFKKKVTDIGWSIHDEKIDVLWFEKNMVYFKFFGRDIETFLSKVKIAHSRRVFCKSVDEKTKLLLIDLEKGFEMFLKNEDVKGRGEEKERNFALSGMYL